MLKDDFNLVGELDEKHIIELLPIQQCYVQLFRT
jgi:hypothetical protein